MLQVYQEEDMPNKYVKSQSLVSVAMKLAETDINDQHAYQARLAILVSLIRSNPQGAAELIVALYQDIALLQMDGPEF